MCPNIEKNCCDEDTYKSMNIWWDDSGEMSMNRIWHFKISSMFEEMKMLKEVYYPEIHKYIETEPQFQDVECSLAYNVAKDMVLVNAFKEFFESYVLTAKKCWQYSINFMRGLMCSVCDFSSTFYFSEKEFNIDDSECWKFNEHCASHLKATIVFLEYVKLFTQIGSCRELGSVIDAAQKPYISKYNQNMVNLCMQNKKSGYCKEVCKQSMPWTGVTLLEQKRFEDIKKLLFSIKHYFPSKKFTKRADETNDAWQTSKDMKLIKLLNQATIKPNAFNITKFYNATQGLSLERLGFLDIKEFIGNADRIVYFAAVLNITWMAVLIAFTMFN